MSPPPCRVFLLVVIQRCPSLDVSACVEVEGTYYCRGLTARRVRGGFLAYAPSPLPGCEPLRYVYKARCDLDHLLGVAVPDSTPTRYTLRIRGVTVRYFPAAKVAIIFAKTPTEAEAVATQCRPP